MTELPSPTDTRLWGPTPFPSWVKSFRPTQWHVVEQIVEAFETVDVVLLEAPTGTGKSLIGEMVRRLLKANAAYTCSTKALQDQIAETFPYAKVVKGRSNYLTEEGKLDKFGNPTSKPWSDITCADCTYQPEEGCRWCSDRNTCSYQVAKNKADMADLAVLNTSYFLTATRFANMFNNRDLVIIDEADLLEGELLSHVEVNITKRYMDELGISGPDVKTPDAKSNDWESWVRTVALPAVTSRRDSLPKPWQSGISVDDARDYNRANDLMGKLTILADELPEGWVYDGYDSGNVIFRPVRVRDFGEKHLWPNGKKFLLMSATILSPGQRAEDWGLVRPYEFIGIDSPFPIENRPIKVWPVADMAFKNRHTAWPEMADGVLRVLAHHPNERVLVHTVSYDLARYLTAECASTLRPLVTYTSSREKAAALAQYKRHPNSVMFAASMDRGVDLPDDLCRVQVVAKIPFPNLKDKRISARLYSHGGSAWYKTQGIQTLIQMCGRGVRSEEDHAVTYILDSQFGSNLWKSSHLFPRWWSDAVNFRFNPNQMKGK